MASASSKRSSSAPHRGRRTRHKPDVNHFTVPLSDSNDDDESAPPHPPRYNHHRHSQFSVKPTGELSSRTLHFTLPVSPQKSGASASHLKDDAPRFVPEDIDEILDINLDGDPDVCDLEDISHVIDPAGKRGPSVCILILYSLFPNAHQCCTVSQDRPLLMWRSERDRYLATFLWLEGRGHSQDKPCRNCELREGMYQCKDCFGYDMFCQDCMVEVHAQNPLHRIEVSWVFLSACNLD